MWTLVSFLLVVYQDRTGGYGNSWWFLEEKAAQVSEEL